MKWKWQILQGLQERNRCNWIPTNWLFCCCWDWDWEEHFGCGRGSVDDYPSHDEEDFFVMIHPILMADCGNGICRFGWKGRNSELIRHELNGHKLLSGMPIFTHNWLVLLLCGSASIDCWMAGIRLIVVWPSNFIKTMRKHVPSFVGACWWSIWGIQFIHLIFQLLSQKGTISKSVTEESVSLSTSLWLAIKLPDNHPMTHKVHKSRSMQSDETRKARVQWHSITGQFVVGVSCPCLRGGG